MEGVPGEDFLEEDCCALGLEGRQSMRILGGYSERGETPGGARPGVGAATTPAWGILGVPQR